MKFVHVVGAKNEKQTLRQTERNNEIQITQAHKKSGINFTCEYATTIDFEPLNPNPVSEFPLDPPVFP